MRYKPLPAILLSACICITAQAQQGLFINQNGFVGIGTQTPDEKLTITGNLHLIGTKSEIYAPDRNHMIVMRGTHNSTGVVDVISYYEWGDHVFYTGGSVQNQQERLRINSIGNVGIGTNSPTARLHVAGSLRIANGQQGEGKVLTSSADGTASWQVPSFPAWNLLGNAGTVNGTHFIGTTDNVPLTFRVNNVYAGKLDYDKNNYFYGREAGQLTSTGTENTAMGFSALSPNTSGSQNTAVGSHALFNNVTGGNNTALGFRADMGSDNLTNATAIGYRALVETNNAIVLGSVNGKNNANANVNVGIGTTSPSFPLHVAVTTTGNFSNYGYLNNNGPVPVGHISGSSGNVGVSIRASGRVVADEFNAVSDARVKRVAGRSDAKADLDILRQIRITDYTYIDSLEKGLRNEKKVIAQELEAIYPNAVGRMEGIIPDIYSPAEINAGVVTISNDLKTGDKVQLIFENHSKTVAEVLYADATSFTVDLPDEGKVFVYGRQVDDFRTVDYDALITLAISAIQQLGRENEKLIRDNDALKEALARLTDDVTVLKSIAALKEAE